MCCGFTESLLIDIQPACCLRSCEDPALLWNSWQAMASCSTFANRDLAEAEALVLLLGA